MDGFDVLIRGSQLMLNQTETIKNAYVYIRNGFIEDYGEEPAPQDYESSTLIIGGKNRIIAPAYGIPYTDALLYHIHPARRGTFEERMKLLEKSDPRTLIRSLYTVLYELSLYGVGIIGIETIDPSIALEATNTSKMKVLPLGCTSEGCIHISRIGSSATSKKVSVLIDNLEELMIYNSYTAPMFTKRFSYNICNLKPLELLAASRTAYVFYGLNWGIIKKAPAMLAIYNFNDLPLYKAGLIDVFDLMRTCKRVETLIVGQDIIVDGGEHLTIGRKLVKDGG